MPRPLYTHSINNRRGWGHVNCAEADTSQVQVPSSMCKALQGRHETLVKPPVIPLSVSGSVI